MGSRYGSSFDRCARPIQSAVKDELTYSAIRAIWMSNHLRSRWRGLERTHPGLAGRIELVSVASPVTTERFTGNTYGSILAWQAFSDAEDAANRLVNKDRMRLPGLRGFSMAGQWVGMGGLIRAATSGRFAVQYLCRELGLDFRAWPSDDQEPWHPGKWGRVPRLDRQAVGAKE